MPKIMGCLLRAFFSQRQSKLSVIMKCPYYAGISKARFDSITNPLGLFKFPPESQASGGDFHYFEFIFNHVVSLRDILSPHFHESSKDQSSYIKCLTAGKNEYSFFTCRSDVILQTTFFTHARKTFVLLNETFQDQ